MSLEQLLQCLVCRVVMLNCKRYAAAWAVIVTGR